VKREEVFKFEEEVNEKKETVSEVIEHKSWCAFSIEEEMRKRREDFERRLAECDQVEFKCRCKEEFKPCKTPCRRPRSAKSCTREKKIKESGLQRRKDYSKYVSRPVTSRLPPVRNCDPVKPACWIQKIKEPERVIFLSII
jgi:hypothetical protein